MNKLAIVDKLCDLAYAVPVALALGSDWVVTCYCSSETQNYFISGCRIDHRVHGPEETTRTVGGSDFPVAQCSVGGKRGDANG